MQLRFLGKVTEGGDSPTLWDDRRRRVRHPGLDARRRTPRAKLATCPTGRRSFASRRSSCEHLPKEDDAAADG